MAWDKTKLGIFGILLFSVSFEGTGAQFGVRPEQLGAMDIDRDKITLSGFSSGGVFAQMLQFSYSSLFAGVATFSHTFYRCGPPTGIVNDYDTACTILNVTSENQFYSTALVHDDIREYERRGLIESTSNLRNKRLYVYAGLRNDFFSPRQTLNVLQVYGPYINSTEAIFTRVQDANLVLPTDKTDFGGPCTDLPTNETFFIGQCGFSGVTEAINFLLSDDWDNLHDAHRQPKVTPQSRLQEFDQTEFLMGLRFHQMDDIGYYYRPRKCRPSTHHKRRCPLHFYFHGCQTGREFAGERHIANTGLLELADRKGMIVIFPQARSSLPQNEIGCWDTFGLGGRFYATQVGEQIRAVKRILDRILGITTPSPSSSSKRPSMPFRPSPPSPSKRPSSQFPSTPTSSSKWPSTQFPSAPTSSSKWPSSQFPSSPTQSFPVPGNNPRRRGYGNIARPAEQRDRDYSSWNTVPPNLNPNTAPLIDPRIANPPRGNRRGGYSWTRDELQAGQRESGYAGSNGLSRKK